MSSRANVAGSYEEAIKLGLSQFQSAAPCKHGHTDLRIVTDTGSKCLTCINARAKVRRKTHLDSNICVQGASHGPVVKRGLCAPCLQTVNDANDALLEYREQNRLCKRGNKHEPPEEGKLFCNACLAKAVARKHKAKASP